MKVIIIGGTGFIGYHTCLELLKQGHEVASVSVPDIRLGDWFPSHVRLYEENIFETSHDRLISLCAGYDALIYSVGPDDRYKPPAPARDYFHDRLVHSCGRVVDAARESGVRKAAIANSYFAYFDRTRPELKLAQRHPYIESRVRQAERVIEAGKGKVDVMVLELPYIFGAMPERTPLWKDVLLKTLHDASTVYFPKGGSAMISVRQVARAFAGALRNGRHGQRYPIGDENLTWNSMLALMLDEMGMGRKKIRNVPKFLLTLFGRKQYREESEKGIESGLNPKYVYGDILCRYFYIDPEESKKALGYGGGDLEPALRETVRACLPL